MNYPENELIMLPGPVPLDEKVLKAMSRPMISHRGPEFAEMYRNIQNMLKEIFQTENEVFVLSGSGTCAMEAAIGNIIGPDDKIVTLVNGKFGERLKEIGNVYGTSIPVEVEWGNSIELDDVEKALAESNAKAVAMVHNETSAGILNPAEEVAKLAKKHDALFIMDGITSIGGDEVYVDKWDVDIALTGSQKCLATPPGLSMISVNERAFNSMLDKVPYYLDLRAYRKASEKAQTPYTPALPLFFALEESLNIMMEEGMDNRIKRHRTLAKGMQAAVDAWGLEMFPQLNATSHYSNTVTAVKMPEGIDDKTLRGTLKKRGIVIAGGQSQLSGKIFRVATMGTLTSDVLLHVIQEIGLVLAENNVIDKAGAGAEAANDAMSQ